MPVNIVVPELGESVVEATVGQWRKAVGDHVSVGEVVVELETEKVDLEVGAAQGGTLARITRKEGETVKIGDILGTIDESTTGSPVEAGERRQFQRETAISPAQPPPVPHADSAAAPRATPSARRLALEQDVDLRQVRPAVEGGPITAADIAENAPVRTGPATAAPVPAAPAGPQPTPSATTRTEERVRMSRRRQTIAVRLVEALHNAAMVTTFNDIDMYAVMELRRRHMDSFKQKYGVSLGIASFFVKAAIAALRAFPRLNAEIQGDEMVLKNYYDIGVAVGARDGLVVPVLRDADRLSFGALEQAIKAYARKAEDGTLTLEDLRGGTFTISNGGVFGSLLSTPILNPPQAGILGLHRIEDRPMSVAGEVRIRPMMYAALSYDHRIVDGLEAVRFLRHLKELVESPGKLLLEG